MHCNVARSLFTLFMLQGPTGFSDMAITIPTTSRLRIMANAWQQQVDRQHSYRLQPRPKCEHIDLSVIAFKLQLRGRRVSPSESPPRSPLTVSTWTCSEMTLSATFRYRVLTCNLQITTLVSSYISEFQRRRTAQERRWHILSSAHII